MSEAIQTDVVVLGAGPGFRERIPYTTHSQKENKTGGTTTGGIELGSSSAKAEDRHKQNKTGGKNIIWTNFEVGENRRN